MKSKKLTFLLSALGIILASYLFLKLHLHINSTSSMPKGIYQEISVPLKIGSLVEVCLPIRIAQFGLARGYIHAGNCPGNAEPVLKEVVALENDTVQINKHEVIVNGQTLPHSQILAYDENAQPLTPIIINGHFVLTKEEVWLYGNQDLKSWDSRYYGAVKRSAIRHILKPIWVW